MRRGKTMPSRAWRCTTGLSLPSSLSLLSVLLCLHVGVQGATLWEPRQQGDDPDTFRPMSHIPPPPSAAMLQALRHIQRLSQQAARNAASDGVNAAEDVGDALRPAAQTRPSVGTRDLRGQEDERGAQEEREEDNGRRWTEAVLSAFQRANEPVTLQEAAHGARGHSVTPHTATHSLFSLSPPPAPTQEQDRQATAMGIRKLDRKFPLLFEDKEGQDQPLKRTNENAEEQYTPQKLATLQSMFEELNRIANSKFYNKRQNAENDEGDNEDYAWYREKKLAFEDGKSEQELTPPEEQTELQEEETQRRQFTGDLGNGVDEENEEAHNRKGDEEDDEVKRSNQSDFLQMVNDEEPDDITRLVDDYLFKLLEKTEQEKQKREEDQEIDDDDEEEEEEENNEEQEKREEEDEQRNNERRAAQLLYREEPLYQLIKLSQKLQIPPEDILDLLESEESKNPNRLWQRTQGQPQRPSLHYPSPLSPHKNPARVLYRRPPQTQEMSTINRDILRILGLSSMAQPGSKPFLRPKQYKPAQALSYSLMERELPDYVVSEGGKEQNRADDDADDEDGLASFLVAELLSQRKRRAPPELQLAVRDFLDDPSLGVPEKRLEEQEKTAEDSDEDTLLGILHYLNLDSDDIDETDLNEKTVAGM